MLMQGAHWTLDNASNNLTFLKELQVYYETTDVEFDAQESWIPCFPHVINIVTQHILEALEEGVQVINNELPNLVDMNDNNDEDDGTGTVVDEDDSDNDNN